jgi:hypothetical protein
VANEHRVDGGSFDPTVGVDPEVLGIILRMVPAAGWWRGVRGAPTVWANWPRVLADRGFEAGNDIAGGRIAQAQQFNIVKSSLRIKPLRGQPCKGESSESITGTR